MSLSAYLEQLGRAHGFTPEELQANRCGELHPAQRLRGMRVGRVGFVVNLLLGTLALCGGLVGAWLFLGSLGDSPSQSNLDAVVLIAVAGLLLALPFYIGAIVTRMKGGRRRQAFLAGQIEVIEGPMQKLQVVGRGGMRSRHLFQVGPRRFDTLPPVWNLLTQGAAYRLYLVHDQLLSLEPVLPDAQESAEYQRELEHAERIRHIKPSGLVK